jgi:hypothetical protein
MIKSYSTVNINMLVQHIIEELQDVTKLPKVISKMIFQHYHSCTTCYQKQASLLNHSEDCETYECCEINSGGKKCLHCNYHLECCNCWAVMPRLIGMAGTGKSTFLH